MPLEAAEPARGRDRGDPRGHRQVLSRRRRLRRDRADQLAGRRARALLPPTTWRTSGRRGTRPRCASTRTPTAPSGRRDVARLGVADDGILRRMARDAADRIAIASYRGPPRPLALFGALQHYAWGGYEFIPRLIGMDNAERRPCAELWMGAHPRGLAQVEIDGTRMTLDRLIAADPWLTLGPDVGLRFSGPASLPLQGAGRAGHGVDPGPSLTGAGGGRFRAGRTRPASPSTPRTGIYRDENHKPEVHVVLTDFWMLHGFRPLEEMFRGPRLGGGARAARRRLLGEARRRGAGGPRRPGRPSCGSCTRAVMTMPQPEVDAILDPLVSRLEAEEASGRLGRDGPGFWALRAARTFPAPGRAPRPGDLLDLPAEPRAPAAGSGNVPARGNPARLPRGRGRRAHGELRQRAARRPHAEARGRARAAGHPLVPRRARRRSSKAGRRRRPAGNTRRRRKSSRWSGSRSPRGSRTREAASTALTRSS